MTRLFVVEDEAVVREDIVRTLQRLGYQVVGSAQGGVEALVAIEQLQPELVLMDIRLSGRMDGIQTTAAIRKRWAIPVIYLTAHSDEATLARAKETGPHGYLLKPFNERDLRTAIEVALKKQEQELRLEQRERWFSTTLDSVGDAVIATDLQDRITFMNPVAERITGWKRVDAQNKPLSEVLKLVGRDAEQAPRAMSAAIRGDFRAELPPRAELVDSAGGSRHVDDSTAPIVDAQGQVLGSVVVFRDVTEKRRLEERLQLAERVASLSTMAANMAHQLNSPLAASIANVDFAVQRLREAAQRPELAALPLAARELLAELTGALEDAQAAGAQVRRIVLDLKKFSRIDEPLRGPVDLPNVLNAALSATEQVARGAVRVSLRLGTTPLIEANEGRLVQAIACLLSNAFEATREQKQRPPQVEIGTHTDDAGRAVLEIRDNGAGISDSVLPRVFEPFFTTKAVGASLGLGLSLSQSTVAELGGELSLESRPNSGTTARVSLPASRLRQSGEPRAAGEAAARKRARVLLIDDEPLVGKTLERLLSREHDVVYEQEGRAALARIERGERFDVILCDLMMPQVTGIDVFERVQALAPQQARQLVFLTGGVVTGRAEAFLETCTNVVIHKPFSMERVLAVVASYAT